MCAFCGCLCNYAVGVSYQVLIVAFYTGSGIIAALGGLATIPLMLLKDAVLIFLACLLYPRIMTMIGKPNEQIEKNEETGVQP